MENVGIFYDQLEYFTAIWYSLWPFGIVCRHLVFFPFWYVWTKKNLATLLDDSHAQTCNAVCIENITSRGSAGYSGVTVLIALRDRMHS
jgi:hypothetical protein